MVQNWVIVAQQFVTKYSASIDMKGEKLVELPHSVPAPQQDLNYQLLSQLLN